MAGLNKHKTFDGFTPLMHGIGYKYNPKYKLHNYTLHYTADPNKNPDTAEGSHWFSMAQQGSNEQKWNKNYELDFSAQVGTKVFPPFDNNIVDEVPYDIRKNYTWYMAIDFGLSVPTAVLWAGVPPEGSPLYIHCEYYEKEKSSSEHKYNIYDIELQQEFPPIYLRLADPSGEHRDIKDMRSLFDAYAEEPFALHFTPGNNDREAGIPEMVEWVKSKKVIFNRACKYLFAEMRNYAFPEKNNNDVPIKRRDHLIDCLRYIIMCEPKFRPIRSPRRDGYRFERYIDKRTGYAPLSAFTLDNDLPELGGFKFE